MISGQTSDRRQYSVKPLGCAGVCEIAEKAKAVASTARFPPHPGASERYTAEAHTIHYYMSVSDTNALRMISSAETPVVSQRSENKSWYVEAACRFDVDRMLPSQPKDLSYIVEARKVCASCPVADECLEYVLEFSLVDMVGFWAGRTVRQLNIEQKKRGVTPKRSTISQVWGQLRR